MADRAAPRRRFCVPFGHDVERTRCVELEVAKGVLPTPREAPADGDGCEVIDDEPPSLRDNSDDEDGADGADATRPPAPPAAPAPPDDAATARSLAAAAEPGLELRCRCCFAGGALSSSTMSAATEQTLLDEAARRDLFYTLKEPSERPVCDDDRVLTVDLQRRVLPLPGDESPLASLVRDGRPGGGGIGAVGAVGGAGDEARRARLSQLLQPSEPLGAALLAHRRTELDESEHDALGALRQRLVELCAEPPGADADEAALERDARREAALSNLFAQWGGMSCRNAIIADFNICLSGCIRGNAVPYSLGAGAGSKGAAMYQIKYMGKNSVEISGGASVLIDAHKHVEQYPSVAEDAEANPTERLAKHFCQRVVNTAALELEGVQAAALVLGIPSSGASDKIAYSSPWDVTKLARIAASGVPDDVDFSHEVDDDDDDDEQQQGAGAAPRGEQAGDVDSDDTDVDSEAEEEELMRAAGGAGGAEDDDGAGAGGGPGARHRGHRCSHGVLGCAAAMRRGARVCKAHALELNDALPDWRENLEAAGAVLIEPGAPKVDLVERFGRDGGARLGASRVYKGPGGAPIPVSTAHHYYYRDEKLTRFTPAEFHRVFEVRQMTRADEKWAEEEVEHRAGTNRRRRVSPGAGRPCERYLLHAPHPLATTHLIVRKAKLDIPALAGAPPPREPPLDAEESPALEKRRRRFAEYMLANFSPWGYKEGAVPPLTYERWQEYVSDLEYDACWYRAREADVTETTPPAEARRLAVARRVRLIAAARLHDIENVTSGFSTKKNVVMLLSKHRERARKLWRDGDRPAGGGGDANGAPADARAAAKALAKLREKAARLRDAKDQSTLQADADAAKRWGESLVGALQSARAPSAPSAEQREREAAALAAQWGLAARPARRSLEAQALGDVTSINKALRAPLVPSGEAEAQPAAAEAAADGARTGGQTAHDPFAPLTDGEYDAAAAAHRAAGLPVAEAPLNPEQRAAGRDFRDYAVYRRAALDRGETPAQIAAHARRDGVDGVDPMLMVGAGGTGKSAVVHTLKRDFRRVGLRRLCVTAYTGVAAAPFGGPTLLSLCNLNVSTKDQLSVRGADPATVEMVRKK